jgi:hypothetical protein
LTFLILKIAPRYSRFIAPCTGNHVFAPRTQLNSYIAAIKRISQQYVDRCERIQKGAELPPNHAFEITIPQLPRDYANSVVV